MKTSRGAAPGAQTIEQQLAEFKQTGNMQLREQIALRGSYIAEIIAKRYTGRGIEYDDLYQVASIGLLFAIDRFDPGFNVKFVTYASAIITGEIKKHFRDTGHFIKIPRRMYEALSHADAQSPMPYSIVSYEQSLGEERDLVIENVIGQVDDSFLIIEDKDFVAQSLQTLTGEEHTFTVARYYENMTQQQIADKMHVSQMYISRLEKKVLKKLREFYLKD